MITEVKIKCDITGCERAIKIKIYPLQMTDHVIDSLLEVSGWKVGKQYRDAKPKRYYCPEHAVWTVEPVGKTK